MMTNRITLNIPHSSTGGLAEADWEPRENLTECVNTLTDWHTDIMFTPEASIFPREVVTPFVFHKNRFVVDAERLIDDPMEKEGEGIVYTQFRGLMYRNVTQEEKDILYCEREEYLSLIEQNIISNDREGFSNILIDCHSFPSCLDAEGKIDICIGFNNDGSEPSKDILCGIRKVFEEAGYSVDWNTPFSNSLQPVKDLSTLHNGYFTFMIELNKRIYLNESDRSLLPESEGVKATLHKLYDFLLRLSI